MTKLCHKCNQSKTLNEFMKDKRNPNGVGSVCLTCKRIIEKQWRDQNRESIKEKQRRHYQQNREVIVEKRKVNYNPLKSRARWLARKLDAKKCIFCDNIGERHHKDYSHPLDIVFLCKSHHKQVHDGTIQL